MTRPEIVWTRLHLPRPLDESRVHALLVDLASQRLRSPIVFELRGTADGVAHLLGCDVTAVHTVKRLLRDELPGVLFSSAPTRTPMEASGRLQLRPMGLPLRTDDPLAVTRGLLSAASVHLTKDEAVAMQIVLGHPHAPALLPADVLPPSTGWWQMLTGSARPANAEERKALRVRTEEPSFAATVRLGTTSPDPDRPQRLVKHLLGAVLTARTPGVWVDLVREDHRLLDSAQLPRRPRLELSCAELVGLIGWPLGEEALPGIPSPHPKPLRPSAAVHDTERVFARSAVLGEDRLVGISSHDALFHGVAYGPSGSGKSTAMLHLVEEDMKAGRPVIVLDPKRQLVDDLLARVPRERRDQVVVLDVGDEQPVGFNPLDVAGRDPDVVVDGIMAVFGDLFAGGWGPRTLDIFSGALRSLARASVITGVPATLADVPRILTDLPFRSTVMGNLQHDEGLASFWGWYDSQSPAAQAAAIAAPLSRLRQLLLRPALLHTLDQRQTRLSLRNIWRENLIVLVPLNEGLIGAGTASMLGSLFVADLWLAIQERAAENTPEKRPGVVYVDEAPRFLHLPSSLADALAVSRSLGVGWFLAAQFVGQFPPEMRSAVDMNARSKIVFRTEYEDANHFTRGVRDLTSEDFMSLGKYEAYANLVADGHPQGWALVRTLPPSKTIADPERVRAHSRARWAAPAPKPVAAPPGPAQAATGPETAPGGPTPPAAQELAVPQLPGQPPPVGRKRRQR
ncbi:type IV secretory system conjugative DNA transfer family protein [Nocardioides sp. WG-D5]